jgi:hypothetical protein
MKRKTKKMPQLWQTNKERKTGKSQLW